MSEAELVEAGGPGAGPLPSRPAIPLGDRATYSSREGFHLLRVNHTGCSGMPA